MLNQEITIYNSAEVTIKDSNKTTGGTSGEVVLAYSNGNLSGTLKRDVDEFATIVSAQGLSFSRQLGKIGAQSFSVAAGVDSNKVTVNFTISTPIDGYQSASQTLTFEFKRNNLSLAQVGNTIKSLADDMAQAFNPYMEGLMILAATVAFCALGYVAILSISPVALSSLGAAIYNLITRIMIR